MGAGGGDWDETRKRLERFRDERDWRQFHTLKDLAAAIAVEAAELQELFLWHSVQDEQELLERAREAIEDELSDVMIQSVNFASAAGIDLQAAIERKIAKNEQRYPADAVRGSPEKAPRR